jgi:pre-rRNA-processing protein TSR1
MSDHHHRSGKLKQNNKKHSTSKATKGALKRAHGSGKVEKRGGHLSSKAQSSLVVKNGKTARLNAAKQRMLAKQEERKAGARLGSARGAPRIVGTIALGSHADLRALGNGIAAVAGSTAVGGAAVGAPVTMTFPRHKARLTVATAPRDLVGLLDVAKAADILLVVLPLHLGAEAAVDAAGDAAVGAIRAQGQPTVVGLLTGLEQFPPKQAAALRKYGQRLFATEFGDEVRVLEVSGGGGGGGAGAGMTAASAELLVRLLAQCPLKALGWKGGRSFLVADRAAVVGAPTGVSTGAEDDGSGLPAGQPLGTLAVSGYVRGRSLRADALVHLTGYGTYRVARLERQQDPHAVTDTKVRPGAAGLAAGGVAVVGTKGGAARRVSRQSSRRRCRSARRWMCSRYRTRWRASRRSPRRRRWRAAAGWAAAATTTTAWTRTAAAAAVAAACRVSWRM